MGDIYGLHEVTLQEGVTEEEFERFLREEYAGVAMPPGYTTYLLKKRLGPGGAQYLLGMVVDGDYYQHDHPEFQAGIQKWFEDNDELEQRRKKLGRTTWVADYTIVGELGKAW